MRAEIATERLETGGSRMFESTEVNLLVVASLACFGLAAAALVKWSRSRSGSRGRSE